MIDHTDLKFECDPDRKRGGQHVGGVSTTVRVTHIPTGITAMCGTERSQHKNRNVATDMIEYALIEIGFIK